MVVDRIDCMLKGKCHRVSRRLWAGRHRCRKGDMGLGGQLVRLRKRRGVKDDELDPDLVAEQQHLSRMSQSVKKMVSSSLHSGELLRLC